VSGFERLKPFDSETGFLNVIIDTPKGCRNEFAYDLAKQIYVFKAILAEGMSFRSILARFPA
jgi:inorganic pyrophosphatase